MTTTSIGARVALRHTQNEISEMKEAATKVGLDLVIPLTDKHTPHITPATMTNTVWCTKLRNCIEKGVNDGLFGTHTVDKMLKLIFKDAQKGWCQGTVDCISVDRNTRIPITQTIEKIFANPDRPCMAQICYGCAKELSIALKDNRSSFFHKVDQACSKGEAFIKTKSCLSLKRALRKAVSFWNSNGLKELDDMRFVAKKHELCSEHFREHSRGSLSFYITIDSKEKIQNAVKLREKILSLRSEILGGPLPVPACVITKDTVEEGTRFLKKNRLRVREIQMSCPSHITTDIFQDGSGYHFDIQCGLAKLPACNPKEKKDLARIFDEDCQKLKVYTR